MIFARKIRFPEFLGQFPALKLRVSGLDPNTNYGNVIMENIGEHCFTGTIVLNRLMFMRLLAFLYSISLDAYARESRKFSNVSPLYSIITVFDII